MKSDFLAARPAIAALRASQIREVANAGMGISDVLAFWFGEPDEVTPDFIREAAIESLRAGETFYSHNLGIAPLREAIAAYVTRLHQPVSASRVAVTNSGVSALMLAAQALVSPGDRVIAVTPLWPNLVEQPKILGANVVTLALDFTREGWRLDLDKLIAALTPDTRALIVNSPNNPTGWTIEREAQRALLAHCRKHGIWIVADDAYERLDYGDTTCAPSFLDIATKDDRLVVTNTFSKSWLMTGWRLGWMIAPEALIDDLGKLIEYNTSCAPVFVQRAGIAAIEQGEPVIAHTLARYRTARDLLTRELAAHTRIAIAPAQGAMYAFFRVDGMRDSLAFCKQLVAHHHLGLAPGVAFGPEGEGFVRWCFASSETRLAAGIERLRQAL